MSAQPAPSVNFTLETRVGRLIEARVFRLADRAEADVYSERLRRETTAHAAERPAVLLADHRPVVVYPQPVTDRLVELFQLMNTRLERVAIVVAPTNATLLLQLERLVREARFPKRRVFREPAGALEHLREALDPAELARARAFLAEHRPGE
jgi:hypothetical protein